MKKRMIGASLCVVLAFGCAARKNPGIVAENFGFAQTQLALAFEEIARCREGLSERQAAKNPVVPRTLNADGSLRLSSARDWTSGFFPGELWFMYEYTRDTSWLMQARRYTACIESEKFNGKTHDMGFKIYCSFGNGYRLTHDEAYRDVMLQAAATLATRFSPDVGAIRSWDHNTDKWQYPVIIDNMMNLELLFWAAGASGDSIYYKIAVSHADKTLANHFRPDASVCHVVDYDPETGAVAHRHTHHGYAHESTWARGEAWALYGYTMCYRETGEERYLKQAQRIADFIFAHPRLPEDLVPYWDYDAPGIPDEPRDVSAAAVTASALYELAEYDVGAGELHRSRADRILSALMGSYRARAGEARGFLLLHSTGSKPHDSEVDVPLVYADYYFLEALLRRERFETTGSALSGV